MEAVERFGAEARVPHHSLLRSCGCPSLLHADASQTSIGLVRAYASVAT